MDTLTLECNKFPDTALSIGPLVDKEEIYIYVRNYKKNSYGIDKKGRYGVEILGVLKDEESAKKLFTFIETIGKAVPTPVHTKLKAMVERTKEIAEESSFAKPVSFIGRIRRIIGYDI